MKIIKQYLAFTPPGYCLIMFGILPAAAAALYGAAAGLLDRNLLYIIPVTLVLAEITADHWMFGGIQADGEAALRMTFLKTSSRGMGLLRNALAADLAGRFLSIAGIMTVCLLEERVLRAEAAWHSAGRSWYLILTAYLISAAGIWVTRFFNSLWINFWVGEAGLVLEAVCYRFSGAADSLLAANVILAALAAGLSILAVRTAVKRAEKAAQR